MSTGRLYWEFPVVITLSAIVSVWALSRTIHLIASLFN